MEKLYKILILASVIIFTASFAMADTPSDSSQVTPTAKSQGKTKSKAVGKAVSKTKAKADKKVVAKDSYVCPMCHISADKPGKCPMCGMDMVKNEKKDDKKASDEKKM